MTMKKIRYIALAALLSCFGCEKYDTLTNDPNKPTEVHPSLLLTNIQAGAFSSRHNAMQLQKKLNALLPNKAIKLAYIDQDKLFRVRIGPISTVNEADRIAEIISENGYPTPHVIIN